MVRPQLRSRSLKKVKKTTPGGRRVVHYSRSKRSRAACPETKKPLPGTKKLNRTRQKNQAKASKRPERPFGNLSAPAMRRKIKEMLKAHGW